MSTLKVNNITDLGDDAVVTSGVLDTLAVPAGGILQVVGASTSTQTVISSTSFQDSGLSATITPTSASNKVLVLIGQHLSTYSVSNDRALSAVQTLRDSTVIVSPGSAYSLGLLVDVVSAGIFEVAGVWYAVNFLDSPATTSAITYKTQIKCNTATAITGQANGVASTITLMEVAG
jgi:hypothetical protein